jgi:hypothetical protein
VPVLRWQQRKRRRSHRSRRPPRRPLHRRQTRTLRTRARITAAPPRGTNGHRHVAQARSRSNGGIGPARLSMRSNAGRRTADLARRSVAPSRTRYSAAEYDEQPAERGADRLQWAELAYECDLHEDPSDEQPPGQVTNYACSIFASPGHPCRDRARHCNDHRERDPTKD